MNSLITIPAYQKTSDTSSKGKGEGHSGKVRSATRDTRQLHDSEYDYYSRED